MQILVTGAAGYIGSTLVDMLLDEYEVIAVDNFMYDNQYALWPHLRDWNLQIHKGDVRDKSFIFPLYKQADVIIPLAAIVGAPACEEKYSDSLEINQNVIIDMVSQLSAKQKVIYPNTNSGYGTQGEQECTEASPLKPISWYGITKCAGEKAVLEHADSCVLRLATVCGISPRMRFDLMCNDFIAKLYYDKQIELFEPGFKRNFVDVKDVARGFRWAINGNLKGVYNLGNPSMNMTKLELAHTVCRYLHLPESSVTIGDGSDIDKRNYNVNNDKIINSGFSFKHSFNQSCDELVKLCKILSKEDISIMRNI